jgi:hypothetical protein
VFNALNKWSTKKANVTQGFYLGDVRLQRFLFLLFHSTFSRHGKAQASLALLIWLNENVLKVAQGHLMFTSRFALVVILNINFH